jgi:hypothetical protein
MQNTTGIEIRKTNHIVLSADTLTSNTTALYSIYENYTGDGYGDLTSTHIVACDFHKNESGINLNTNQRTIQDLVIDSCLFRNHTDAAISVGGGGYGPHIHSISITNNSVHDNGSGILFPQFYSSASGALTPYPVIVQKNTVINNSGDAFSKGYGEVGVLIEDNTVTNNGRVLSLTSGQSMPCLFRYNTVTGNSSGVKIGDNASYIPANWEFQKNNFEQNAGVLFDVAYGSGFTIQSNNIVNNNGTPIMRNTTAIDVDATGNYWGSVLESNIPGLIEDYYDNFTYGKVLFTPVVLTRITDAGRRQ